MFMNMKLLSFLIFVLAVWISGCATVGPPVTSYEVSAKRVELEQKAIAYRNLQTKRIEAISHRLISFMLPEDQEKLRNLHIKILESADINAHASWNELSLTYGIIRFTESDDEIAVVVAHELAHMLRGHVGKSLATNTLSMAVGSAAAIALDSLTQGSGIGSSVGNVVSQGVSGSFSRDFEREADYYGFQYAYIAGFNILEGSKIWERLSIEAPQTLTANLLSSHPSSPERLVRAEKSLEELLANGIRPNVFRTPDAGISASYPSPNMLQKAMIIPTRVLSVPGAVLNQTVARPLSVLPSQGTNSLSSHQELENQKESLEAQKAELSQTEQELQARQDELARLLEEQNKRLQSVRDQAKRQAEEQAEFERVLLEAKEASRQNRYDEFGIERMGIAKKVTNLWLGQSVQGNQEIFPIAQGSINWYVKYHQWSANSWKALASIYRKYHAYWYLPDGKLFKEQNFQQSKGRTDFAKATLHWDPELGERLIGEWTLRIFENGKLVDERTFELVK